MEDKKIEKQEKPELNKANSESSVSTNVIGTGKFLGYKVVNVHGKEVKVPVYDGNPNLDIQPDKMQCDDYFKYVWSFDHYKQKAGKWLEIWQSSSYYKSCNELYTKWGFTNYLCTGSSWQTVADSAGFNDDSLMGLVFKGENGGYSLATGSYKQYYLDEPIEDDYNANQVINIATSVSPSKLFMGSYVDPVGLGSGIGNEYKDILNSKSNTFMMCDQYFVEMINAIIGQILRAFMEVIG